MIVIVCQSAQPTVALIKSEWSIIVISGISGQSGKMSSSIDILIFELLQSHQMGSILIPEPACSLSIKYPGVLSQLQAFTFSSVALISHHHLTQQSPQSI